MLASSAALEYITDIAASDKIKTGRLKEMTDYQQKTLAHLNEKLNSIAEELKGAHSEMAEYQRRIDRGESVEYNTDQFGEAKAAYDLLQIHRGHVVTAIETTVNSN